MKILVTGAAGFIGFHLIRSLLDAGETVIGIDNINNYYDQKLKLSRLAILRNSTAFSFFEIDISSRKDVELIFDEHKFDVVINLAAQAGVRYSIKNPSAYIDSNLVGFANILEGCRTQRLSHFLYASSSSVYGMNTSQPFNTNDQVDFPVSLYAATKKANEVMAFSYSHLYQIPTTGLRFFTVYGPYGRPDMAYFSFTKKILLGETIDVFNHGEMSRDFTYIDDIVEGMMRVIYLPPKNQSPLNSNAQAPYKLYNIGNNNPVTIRRFINAIEAACDRKAIENHLPMQAGDVLTTYANIDDLVQDTGFRPKTSIEEGMLSFVSWYKDFYRV
ncbi:MAG: NAD-dependent epimerase/dehydratase family protein [Methylophilus methylotrophus]|uniref:NAD-dependent epimerase/dehydratase family protein n=1 Tax=Methylophilus methylotrophus TaxID=17 RepID=A0A5C7WLD2_METME|nr:MAG: NAD-dependent epimerase/dehydratase family protein [Methylophilus methylotrophus]